MIGNLDKIKANIKAEYLAYLQNSYPDIYQRQGAQADAVFDKYFAEFMKLLSSHASEIVLTLDESKKQKLAHDLVRNIASMASKLPKTASDDLIIKAALDSYRTDLINITDFIHPYLPAINSSLGTKSKTSKDLTSDLGVTITTRVMTDARLNPPPITINYAMNAGNVGANFAVVVNAALANMKLNPIQAKNFFNTFANLTAGMLVGFGNQGKPFVTEKGGSKYIDENVIKAIVESATQLAKLPHLQLLEKDAQSKYAQELVTQMVAQNRKITQDYKKGFPRALDAIKHNEARDKMIAGLNKANDNLEQQWRGRFDRAAAQQPVTFPPLLSIPKVTIQEEKDLGPLPTPPAVFPESGSTDSLKKPLSERRQSMKEEVKEFRGSMEKLNADSKRAPPIAVGWKAASQSHPPKKAETVKPDKPKKNIGDHRLK